MQHLVVFLSIGVVYGQYYDSFTGKEINRTRFEEFERVGLVPVCAMRVNPCDPLAPRRMDLSCNNLHYPARGPAFTPFTRMLPPVFSEGGELRRAKSGRPLPRVRPLRVALMSDGRRSHKKHTHMMANFNVFIAGDTTSVHDTVNYVGVTTTCCQAGGELNPNCMPVQVPDDDIHLRHSNVRCMNLTRAITYQQLGCVSDIVPRERINLAAPMLELSGVYGHSGDAAARGRQYEGGRLRATTINGREWPPSGAPVCLNNVPPRETHCHDSPAPGANSLLGINLVFIWFYRSHNAIADALSKLNPCWTDDKLYYTAREINIAYNSQIAYYEMMPELFGWEFLLRNKVVYDTQGHVDDYDPTLEPRLSIEYSTGSRWFHTLQEGTLNLYKPDGRLYGSVQVVDMILRSGALLIDGNMEGMTQGSFRQPGGAIDEVVDPDIGERVLGRLQFASDVLASDITKGRDFGLPPYNQYRKACGLPEAKKFKDLLGWMDRPQVEAMASFYEHPDDIDLLAALLAEKPMPAAELGPTLACILAEQLLRWRRADRFWFEHSGQPGAFTAEQLHQIRKITFGKLLCQHGDGVTAVQPQIFLLPGHGNEITNCSEYDMPDLSVFRDARCYPHPMPRDEEYPEPTPRYQEYPEPTPRYQEYPQPMPRLQDYLQSTPRHGEYLQSTPRHGEYLQSTPRHEEHLQPTPRYREYPRLTPHKQHTTLKDYLTQTFTNPSMSYPYENPSNVGYYDSTILNLNSDLDSTFIQGQDGDLRKSGYFNDHRNTKKGQCDPKFSCLFPNKQPDVNIYPNADSNSKFFKDVSIQSTANLNSNSRKQDLKYISHPSLRNEKYPFEEFLQNYWQTNA